MIKKLQGDRKSGAGISEDMRYQVILGDVYLQNGKKQEAYEAYQKVLAVEPDIRWRFSRWLPIMSDWIRKNCISNNGHIIAE